MNLIGTAGSSYFGINYLVAAILILWMTLTTAQTTEMMNEEEDELVDTEEAEKVGFTNTREFKAIIGGVAGFWGGVFSMGSIYLLMVFAKRVFNPEEAEDKGGS